MLSVNGREALLGCKPHELGVSPWIVIAQSRINAFADATDDHAWIHVDTTRATRDMPGGLTIAHGFLCLSLLPRLLDGLVQIDGTQRMFNYGMEHLRFVSPVASGSRIRLKGALKSVRPRSAVDVAVTYDCIVELEGSGRPALIGEWLALYCF